jgi:hypothetical protein
MLANELRTEVSSDHPALKALNGIHFWISINKKGAARISHQDDTVPLDQASIENRSKVISGIEETLGGFSHTLTPFLFTSPFPDVEGAYELDDLGDKLRISYREAQFNVETFMTRDFEVIEMNLNGPGLSVSIRPQLTRTAKGFILSGYSGTYQPVAGGRAIPISVRIEYREVEGFRVPAKLSVDADTHKVDFEFSDYHIKKV